MFNPRILVFTLVEVATLVIWLVLALQARDIFEGILAVVVLVIGFTLEHLITYNVVHKRPLLNFSGLPIGQKFVVSIVETVIWVVWLILLRTELFPLGINILIATVFLFLTLLVEHTISDNVFTHRRLFERIFTRRVIGFSIIEASAAGIWFAFVEFDLALIGIVILFVGSLNEHIIAVKLSQSQTNGK